MDDDFVNLWKLVNLTTFSKVNFYTLALKCIEVHAWNISLLQATGFDSSLIKIKNQLVLCLKISACDQHIVALTSAGQIFRYKSLMYCIALKLGNQKIFSRINHITNSYMSNTRIIIPQACFRMLSIALEKVKQIQLGLDIPLCTGNLQTRQKFVFAQRINSFGCRIFWAETVSFSCKISLFLKLTFQNAES